MQGTVSSSAGLVSSNSNTEVTMVKLVGERVRNFIEDWGLFIALGPWVILGWIKLGRLAALALAT